MISSTQYSLSEQTEGLLDPHHNDFYQKLRLGIREWSESSDKKAGKWSGYFLFAPDLFHLLCKLSVDSEVPAKIRLKLAGAIVYFAAPFDLMPEALLGFIGFADDIALAAYVLNSMLNTCNPEIVKRHWAGDHDILKLIQGIMKRIDSAGRSGILGKGVWKKAKKMFR
jgi:uncharacterized membrane protein YkvA (DUF1232 family)